MEQDALTSSKHLAPFKAGNMKKVLLFLIIIGLGFGVSFGLNSSKAVQKNDKQVLATQVDPTVHQTTTSRPGIPRTIKIPTINVDAPVESVGMDSEGAMDVPSKSENTAWFDMGYRPGQVGNAVIDGHYDKSDGKPAVFWNIGKLQSGDKIILTDDAGKELTFAVTKIAKYPYDTFPIKEVFGDASTPMLNLITCHGQWNKDSKNYSERLVVYSQLLK